MRELNKSLQSHGFQSGEIHGDMDQTSRLRELDRFKNGSINILVASDVAARGLDVKGVSHVFNFDTPWHPNDYVHRIGRTGRAGAKGRAFTLVAEEDGEAIENVEKLTGSAIPVFGKKDVRVELVEQPARSPDAGSPSESKPKAKRDAGRDEQRTSRAQSHKPEKAEKAKAPREREDRSADPGKPGEWNGPQPDFLSVSAL